MSDTTQKTSVTSPDATVTAHVSVRELTARVAEQGVQVELRGVTAFSIGQVNPDSPQRLTEFQKEQIFTIRLLTITFMTIGIAYFPAAPFLFGPLLDPLKILWVRQILRLLIIVAFVPIGISIYYGYLVNGNIIWQLQQSTFEAFFPTIRGHAKKQLRFFFVSGIVVLAAVMVGYVVCYIATWMGYC